MKNKRIRSLLYTQHGESALYNKYPIKDNSLWFLFRTKPYTTIEHTIQHTIKSSYILSDNTSFYLNGHRIYRVDKDLKFDLSRLM